MKSEIGNFSPNWLPPLAVAGGSLLLAAAIAAAGPDGALSTFAVGFILLVPVPAAIVLCAIFTALPLVRRLFPDQPVSLGIATCGALGLGIQGLLVLSLGLAGWINHSTAVAIVFVPGALGAIDLAIANPLRIVAPMPPTRPPRHRSPSRRCRRAASP